MASDADRVCAAIAALREDIAELKTRLNDVAASTKRSIDELRAELLQNDGSSAKRKRAVKGPASRQWSEAEVCMWLNETVPTCKCSFLEMFKMPEFRNNAAMFDAALESGTAQMSNFVRNSFEVLTSCSELGEWPVRSVKLSPNSTKKTVFVRDAVSGWIVLSDEVQKDWYSAFSHQLMQQFLMWKAPLPKTIDMDNRTNAIHSSLFGAKSQSFGKIHDWVAKNLPPSNP